jgi:hypothetical protein
MDLVLLLDPGWICCCCWIRDPGWIKSGSGIVADPQHCNILLAGFFSGSPKSRRQSAVIQKLADMIGYNVKLYDMTLQFLRTLFLRTRNVHYCTLRSELLMALHDRYGILHFYL